MTGLDLTGVFPPGVGAYSSCRAGGVSVGPFASMNVAMHVGDAPDAVASNRRLLAQQAGLPAEPLWLQQLHGAGVVEVGEGDALPPAADASVAFAPGRVCAVLTADCLPVLFAHRSGLAVGAAHAGWRGLAGGVLEETLAALCTQTGEPASHFCAWLGPAIGAGAFEVGREVFEAFVDNDPGARQAFVACSDGHWLADIYALARRRLRHMGVSEVYGGGLCTFSDSERFFSYRRDRVCGRMASLIWIKP